MSERDVERPAKALHIDEIEGMAGPGTLTWHPVRATLGIRAFGTNAYTANERGVDVVEPHDEAPDPNSHRHAVAAEVGTTVLSFGGPPTFEPSPWEWSFRASALREDGDPAGARATLEESLARAFATTRSSGHSLASSYAPPRSRARRAA